MDFQPALPPSEQLPAGSTPLKRPRRLWLWLSLGFLGLGSITCLVVVLIISLLRTPAANISQAVTNVTNCEELYRQGDFDGALAACDDAIASMPTYAPAYVMRGYLYYVQGDYQKALVDFDAALTHDPNNGEAYLNRGLTYEKMRNVEATIQNYNEMFEHDIPNAIERAYGYNNRGVAYEANGNPERAIEDYIRAIEQDPNVPEPYENLKRIYLGNTDSDGLVLVYTGLIERFPKEAEILFQRGAIYRMKGQSKEALADFQACLELKPSEELRLNAEAQIKELEGLIR